MIANPYSLTEDDRRRREAERMEAETELIIRAAEANRPELAPVSRCAAAQAIIQAVDRTGEDARIVTLIRRLTESGGTTLEIGVALNLENAEYEYRVEWRDETFSIVAWDKDLLMALEKCDDDVAL